MSYEVQSQDDEVKVMVNAGTDKKTGKPQTDVIIRRKGYEGVHRHIVISEDGETVYDSVNKDHS